MKVDLLRTDLPSVVAELFPDFPEIYGARGWSMLPGLDRVYDNSLAVRELGFSPFEKHMQVGRIDCKESPKPISRPL